MDIIFEITDKSKRRIHLSKERWKHIRKKHPEVEDSEMLKETIQNPDKITDNTLDETINYYFKHYKDKALPNRYLRIAVKYLNNSGYIITAYFGRDIK